MAEVAPEVIEALCRAGNADHGTARESTPVNLWRRMFKMKSETPDMSNDELVKRINRSVSPALQKECPFMPHFVAQWSGGKDGSVLAEIERWEKLNTIKRKLKGSDLKQLAFLPVQRFRTWVPAMLKATIVHPKEFLATGLWTAADLTSLKNKNARLMGLIDLALEDINAANAYVDAHARDKVEEGEIFIATSTLDSCVFVCGLACMNS